MTAELARLFRTRALLIVIVTACAAAAPPLQAQKPAPAQKLDEAYTKLIEDTRRTRGSARSWSTTCRRATRCRRPSSSSGASPARLTS